MKPANAVLGRWCRSLTMFACYKIVVDAVGCRATVTHIATHSPENTMNAYATIEFLSNTTTNGRTVRRALVDLSTATGQWLGSFSVLGFTTQQLKDRAYMEADLNLTNKGYTLQSLREAA